MKELRPRVFRGDNSGNLATIQELSDAVDDGEATQLALEIAAELLIAQKREDRKIILRKRGWRGVFTGDETIRFL